MDDSRTQAREGGAHMPERYAGPSAKRIADLLPHRVSYERVWFWTTTAICHGGWSDGLAFRQRPDGEGIDVRCHTGGCSRGVVLTHLEAAIGLPIWTAYAPVSDAAVKAPEKPAVVEAQAGRGSWGGCPGRCGAAHHRRRGGLRAEPRRAGHRGVAAQAVHAAHGAEAQTLTRGGRLLSHTHPNTQGSSPSGDGPSSLPARAQSKGNTTRSNCLESQEE